MAFKEVRSRVSLFRPWAFGESQTFKKQKEDDTNAISSIIPVSNRLLTTTEKRSDLKFPETYPIHDTNKNNASSFSAFRSTSQLLSQSLPYLDTYCGGPQQMVNACVPDVRHFLPQNSEKISIPSMIETNSYLSPFHASEVPEVHFPVTHHLNQQESRSLLKCRPKKLRPKRFQCPHCEVSFCNQGQLKGHIRIHTGERPFACDHPSCGKTFTRNEELTRHKRIHTGNRPHACIVCGKRFGRRDHLSKHVKTHQRANVIRMPVGTFPSLSYFVSDCIPWF